MFAYRRRMTRDVARWREAGWVTAEGEQKIRAELEQGGIGLGAVLAILASILLAFAAISFVAANWNEMPRLARLGLLFGALWAGYAAAGYFETRGQKHFSDAAVLFAVAIFGISIMLISQMLQIDGNPPDGVLVWWLGALAAGVLLRSNPALAFAMILVGVWTSMEMDQRHDVYWPFLIGWGLVSAAYVWQHWWPGVHLSGLALAIFVFSIGLFYHHESADKIATALGLGAVAVSVAGERLKPDWPQFWPVALTYGAAAAFLGFMLLQFYKTPDQQTFIILAAVTLLLLLALIWWALRTHNRGALWLGYAAFSVEILAIYGEKIGTLLNTSMFFLAAGLLVAALAYMAVRLNAERTAQEVRL